MDMVSRGQGNMARIDKRVSGFYKYWRDRPFPCFDTFPYKLHLGCDEYGHPLLPLRGRETSGTTILVTQAYADTFQRIWQFREAGSAHEGIVLTGQPGIGKTTVRQQFDANLQKAERREGPPPRKTRKVAPAPKVDVRVEYVLVCPMDAPEAPSWQMPEGWAAGSQNLTVNDHFGGAFCLRIPFKVAGGG